MPWIHRLISGTTCALGAAPHSQKPLMRQLKLSKFAKALLKDYGAEKKITELNFPKTKQSMMILVSDTKMVKLY